MTQWFEVWTIVLDGEMNLGRKSKQTLHSGKEVRRILNAMYYEFIDKGIPAHRFSKGANEFLDAYLPNGLVIQWQGWWFTY